VKRWLIALTLLPVALLLLLLFVIGTESGLRFALWQVKTFTPATLQVRSVEGKLLGPLDITGLSLSTESISMEIDSLALRWNPIALLKRNVTVERLNLDGVQIKPAGKSAAATESNDTPFTLPDRLALPIGIEFRNITITNIVLNNAAATPPVLIDTVALQLQYDRDSDMLTSSVKVNSSLIKVDSLLNVNTVDSYPVDGRINWSVHVPELAPASGRTTLSGSINALRIEQRIAPPYSTDATVVLRDPLASLIVDASGRVDIRNAAAIRTGLPAIGVAGDFSFKGQPNDGVLHSSLTFTGELPGTINSVLNATVDQQLITLDALQLSVAGQPLELIASGSADLSGQQPIMDLAVRWNAVQWPWSQEQVQLIRATGKATLKGSTDNAKLSFETAVNHTGTIAGEADLTGQTIDANLQWTTLQWPVDGSVIDNLTGGVKANGQIDGYTLTFNSTLDTPQLNDIALKANGAGTQKSLYLPTVSVLAGDSTLDGSVRVGWVPSLAFDVTVDGDAINPGVFAPDFPGNITASLSAHGETTDNTLHASLDLLTLTGQLRGQPLSATARATVNGSDIALESLQLNAGDTTLSAGGTLSEELDFSFSLDSTDLSTLLPDTAGSIVAQGQISGSSSLPSIELDLTGRSLRYAERTLQTIDLNANLDASPDGPISIELDLGHGTAAGVNLETLKLIADGQIDAHRISVAGKSNQGDIELELSGALAEQIWQFTLEGATLAYPGIAPWRLISPADGVVSDGAISLDRTCFNSAAAQICASAEQTTTATEARYQLSQFQLETLQPFLPSATKIAGLLDSKGAVSMPAGKALTAEFSASLSATTVHVENTDADSTRILALEPSEVIGSISDKGSVLNAHLNLGQQGQLTAAIAVGGPVTEFMDGTLSGQLEGTLNNIDVVEQLIPVLEDVDGNVAFGFGLAGTPRKPLLDGELTLANGKVALTEPGIIISDVTTRISANGTSELEVFATARSNEGAMRIAGTLDLAAGPSPDLSLTLTGEQFQVVNTLEAEVVLSPDLNIDYNSEGLLITGEVQIPLLALTPKKAPAGVVSVSADQQVIGQESTDKLAAPVDVRADVKIVLGDEVYIDAFGLNASLSGSLAVKEVPDKETTATGQLDVQDGTFRAYGQNLVIQKGRIIYAGGPISKPGFDIEAVRNITSELQVGIRARGALAQPQFSLFSDPPMSESEQMSYLVLGRPLQDNSPSENSAMRQAAMALSVAGGKLLTEKFGDKLGLDQVAIDSELRESGEQAALVVGKYLSPRLFVSYGIGLFEPVSTLKLDYTINRNIKLISETTESKSGGDIVFTFEGGK